MGEKQKKKKLGYAEDIMKQLSICLRHLFSQDFRGRMKSREQRQHLKRCLKVSCD